MGIFVQYNVGLTLVVEGGDHNYLPGATTVVFILVLQTLGRDIQAVVLCVLNLQNIKKGR